MSQATPPDAHPPPPSRPGAAGWIAAALVLGLYLASAVWHVRYGGQNTDEGFYAVATRAVAHGEVPYRDFGFTQPPLVLYANALPLRLLGFGLFTQRAVNGLWAALALALAATWLARRTRFAWALGLVAFFGLSAPWMYFIHLGKTYGLTTLLVMLATWAFLALRAGPRRNFALGGLTALGLATRLPAAPFFLLLWGLALWPRRLPTAREFFAGAAGLALGAAVAILPFWIAAPTAMKFWVVDFHRVSVPLRAWRPTWRDIAALAPAVWLLVALAVVVALLRRRWFTREAGVIVAAVVALAANLLPSGAYEEYGVVFLLPLALAAAALVYDELQSRPAVVTLAGVTLLVAARALTAPVLYRDSLPDRRGTASQWLTVNASPYDRALPAQIAAARDVVDRTLAPGAPFIGTHLILAAETGRDVPRELRMGAFSFTDEMPPARAAQLHLATKAQLDAWYANHDVTLLAFFTRWDLDYGWSMPSFAPNPDNVRQETQARLVRDFAVAYREGEFLLLVRRDFRGLPR